MDFFDFFQIKGYQIILALFLDLLIGDPKILPHPIVGIGKIISTFEKFFRKLSFLSERIKGVFLALSVLLIALTFSFVGLLILREISKFSFWLEEGLFIFFVSLFLALKGLITVGEEVEKALEENSISLARKKLVALVGRDTDGLGKEEIRKAVLESYAENLNDGVIAPLFWLTLLGFPGLVLYKTINTLDSMVGYKNEKYLKLGWFSAKVDDIVNFIPARITALLLVISSFFLLGVSSSLRSLTTVLREAKKHPSPNSGYPEGALAGALGVKLLGPAYYEGKLIEKPYIGTELSKVSPQSIKMAQKLLYSSSFLMLLIILLFKGLK